METNENNLEQINKRLASLDIPPLTLVNNPRLEIVKELLDKIDDAFLALKNVKHSAKYGLYRLKK